MASDSVRIARLAALGRLWGEVKYFHPYIAYRPIDWDAAFFAAYPLVNAARTPGEYADAVQVMLSALHDSVTRVLKPHRAPGTASGPTTRLTQWLGDSTLLVRFAALGDLVDFNQASLRLDSIGAGMTGARALILDFRGTSVARSDDQAPDVAYLFQNGFPRAFSSRLVTEAVTGPVERRRMHSGFAPQNGSSSGGYYSGFYTVDGSPILPGPGAKERPLVAIVDEESSLPDVVVALQRAGKAWIVAAGGAPLSGSGAPHTITLADSVRVDVRTSEPASAGTLLPDTVLLRSASDAEFIDAANAMLHATRLAAKASSAGALAPPTVARTEASYSAYPDSAHRVLAAFRFWTAIQYFYPYKHLMGEDWNAVLPSSIRLMEEARDSTAFALAVVQMVAHIHDSHGFVGGAALPAYRGVAYPAVQVRMIEGRPVVTAVRDSSQGIFVGDEVVSVDGEAAAARLARYARTYAGSNAWALARNAVGTFLNGPEGSSAALRLRGANGVVRDVRVTRKAANRTLLGDQRTGPVFRVLPGGIGYVDLDRLSGPQVDSMFDALKNTPAIIFDMRGYPKGTAWSIAPRLAVHQGTGAALFRRIVLLSPDTTELTAQQFVQSIPTTTKPRYAGRTVMLIDERTQSQAEHTGLFFEAANGTAFIGSPSAGANGDVTAVVLPGKMTASFSGHDVRHIDGRQLQRVGLQPQVVVRPTIAGIRAGRDDVLDAALRYLGDRPKVTGGSTTVRK